MTNPHERDETPDQPDNADNNHPENPSDSTAENAPDFDFLDRPISDLKDDEFLDRWREKDPEGYVRFHENIRRALAPALKNVNFSGLGHVVDTSKFATALTADAWKSMAGIEPPRLTPLIEPNMLAKFSGAYPDPSKWAVPGLAEYAADMAEAFAPTVDMTKFYAPVIDAQRMLATTGAFNIGQELQRSLDKTYEDIAKSFSNLGVIDSSLFKEAQRVSQQYADLIKPLDTDDDPLPYLEQFHSDFLVLYASLVLAAGHLENLVADLCEELLRKEQFHGASVAAQQQVGNMRQTLEDQKKCTTCSELARQARDPLKRRNLLVHGDWLVGEEIASDELKERHAWYWRISRTSRVTKRKLMKTEEMQALAAEWDAGKTKTLGDLFHSEVVSLGLVTAYVNKFAELNDKLEKELERHENEREKREANA